MIFLALTSYFGIGFVCFLITLFVNRIFRLSLFVIDGDGERVTWGTLGFFLIIAWPILFPILVFIGIVILIMLGCNSLARKFSAGACND